jgi:hypothetical protein
MPRSCAARWTLPDIEALLAAGRIEDAIAAATAMGEGIDDTAVALRRERLALALALGDRRSAGALPLARVVGELSTFADRALDAAIAAAIRRRAPDAEPRGFPRSRWASTARANSTIRPTSIPSCSTIRSPCPDAIATSRAKPRSAWRARSSNSPP